MSVSAQRLSSPAPERRMSRIAATLACLTLSFIGDSAFADCGNPTIRFLESDRIADKSQGFSEPSGLSLTEDGQHFLSVSDDTAALFLLDPDGTLRQRQDLALNSSDLEGVALDTAGKRILAVSEGTASIVVIDAKSGDVDEIALSDIDGYKQAKRSFKKSDPNDGLEGIAVDAKRDRVFILKEKRPRVLLELSADLTKILRVTELTSDLGFADDDQSDRKLDVSGLAIDAPTGCLWIVSDKAERLFLFDPAGDNPAQSYPLDWLDDAKPRAIKNAEGIAHQAETDRLYIVNDKGKASRLFTFEVRR